MSLALEYTKNYTLRPLAQKSFAPLSICGNTVAIQCHISLRSSAQAQLMVPHTRTVVGHPHAFSVAGLTDWNGLPDVLRLMPVAHSALLLSGLKTTLFDQGWTGSAPE